MTDQFLTQHDLNDDDCISTNCLNSKVEKVLLKLGRFYFKVSTAITINFQIRSKQMAFFEINN